MVGCSVEGRLWLAEGELVWKIRNFVDIGNTYHGSNQTHRVTANFNMHVQVPIACFEAQMLFNPGSCMRVLCVTLFSLQQLRGADFMAFAWNFLFFELLFPLSGPNRCRRCSGR